MSSLLKDAIADAKQLREAAEQNAKNAIVAAVEPRIRRLIENQLLGEDASVDDDDNILLDDEGGDSGNTVPTSSPPAPRPGTTAASAGTAANITLPDGEGKITVDLDSLKTDGQTQSQVGMGGGNPPMGVPGGAPPAGGGTMDVVLDDEAMQALGGLGESSRAAISTKIVESEINIRSLKAASKKLGPAGTLARANQIKAVLESTYRHAQSSGSSLDSRTSAHIEKRLEKLYTEVGTLMSEARVADLNNRIMRLESRLSACRDVSKSRMTEGAKVKFDTFLKEIRDEVSAASYIVEDRSAVLDVHLKEIFRAGRKLLDMYKETKEMSMRKGRLLNEEDIMLRLTLPEDSELEATDLGVEVVDEEGDGDGDADDFGGDLGDEGGDDFDLDGLDDFGGEGEEEEEEPVEEMALEGEDLDEGDELDEGEDEMDENEVVEIDESMLRSEILRMKQIAEARKKKAKKDPKKDVKKAKKDVKEGVKVGKPESTGTNGPGKFDSFGGGKDEGHPFINNTYSEIQKESRRNRTLLKKLAEYKAAFEAARGKLAETNLFNAKLLYANKLLQNTNITPRQRESAIGSLDAAKSLREVKLVYSSLIGASRSGKGGLSESVNRTRGSGSRPARSGAATLNEAAEVKRWAVLAGISDKDSE